MKYVAPGYGLASFTCPHCHTLAQHDWESAFVRGRSMFAISKCSNCNEGTVWKDKDTRIYPLTTTAPPPNEYMPEEIRTLYAEASEISSRSPRAAGALLRLAVDRLCVQLTGNDDGVNKNIGALQKQGLPKPAIQVMDSIRIVGNDCVHPGEIDTDDPETIAVLFPLLNQIVASLIETPEKAEALFNKLPERKRNAVERRDTPPDQPN